MRKAQLLDEETSFVSTAGRGNNNSTVWTIERRSIVEVHQEATMAHSMVYPSRRGAAVPARSAAAPRPGLLKRIADAVFESRRRQAERDIARFVASTGGRITDDIERQMTQRLVGGDWTFRR
jgi:hypothetical protein